MLMVADKVEGQTRSGCETEGPRDGSSSLSSKEIPASSTSTCKTTLQGSAARAKAALGYTNPRGRSGSASQRTRSSNAEIATESTFVRNWIPEDVCFYTGADIEPNLLGAVKGLKRTFDAFCYQLDHTAICVHLVAFLVTGGAARILFDKANFLSSSCARQAPRVLELWEKGCQMKVVPKPGWASMHAKTVIFDNNCVFTGSVNMTHNGFEKNKEHLIALKIPSVVTQFASDFENEWATAEPVTQELIEDMMSRFRKREDAKEEKQLQRRCGGHVSWEASRHRLSRVLQVGGC